MAHKTSKVAIFVDGCFWHGCPRHHRLPKTRVDFWKAKLAYNHDLRGRVSRQLRDEDWLVLAFWECDLRERQAAIVDEVRVAIQGRRPMVPPRPKPSLR